MPLRAGAPFKSVTVTLSEDMSACDSLGCEISFYGTPAAGKRRDISQTDIFKNGMLSTRAEVFGAPDQGGMPAIVLEQGNIDRGSSFNLFRYDPQLGRYKFIGQVSGYAAGKATATQSAPRLPVRNEARPLSGQISYAGPSTYKGLTTVQDMELTVSGSVISGVVATPMMGRVFTVPISGTYESGNCALNLKGDTYTGPCDQRGFAGQRLSKKGQVVGSFNFQNADDLPAVASAARSAPPPQYGNAAPGPVSAASSVWTLGRVRILTERGATPSAGQLRRSLTP